VAKAEFAAVRDSVEITAPTLSKQVALLEAAGDVGVEKGRVGRMPRTWLTLTVAGRTRTVGTWTPCTRSPGCRAERRGTAVRCTTARRSDLGSHHGW
jgi:hypothetical protein